jgi:CheY-like chemotaxis protein
MAQHAPLGGKRILVVEDDFLLAEVLTDILANAGADVLGPFGWMDEALSFVTHHGGAFDCAVLDINLHGDKSFPIADALAILDIPFVFSTGYGVDTIPEAYRDYPRCEKPFTQDVLIAELVSVVK